MAAATVYKYRDGFPRRKEKPCPRRRVGMALAALGALVAAPAAAQVRYTLAPSAEYTWWDDGLFLENHALFGVRLGADFGRLIGLTAYYHRANDLRVGLSRSPLLDSTGTAFGDTRTDVSTLGANVTFKLGVGRVVPFVHGGAGVIRFDPSDGKRLDLINYRFGGGLQYDVASNVRGQLFVEDSRFRLDPAAFTYLTPAAGPPTRRSNWTVGASLGFALGGALDGGGPGTDKWSLASIPIEPFVGRLEWEDSTLSRQTVAGVRTGIDVGTHFGLRAFYWQGRSDGLGDRRPIQGYGAEAQFNLTSGLGPAPYLVAGAAQLDFEDGFVDSNGATREDETALIVGGGLGIRLTDQFRLNISARDYIRSERKFDDVIAFDDLTHNWMLSAGIGFNLGRSRREVSEPRVEARMPRRTAVVESPIRTRPADTVYVAAAADSAVAGGRVAILPAPTTGEIYVRYGPGPSRLHRDATGHAEAELQSTERMAPRSLNQDDMDDLVRRLTVVIERLLEQRDATTRRLEAEPPRTREPLAAVPEAAREREPVARRPPDTAEPDLPADRVTMSASDNATDAGIRIRSVSPYAGLSVGSVSQLAAGLRADAGPVLGIDALRLVPQFALGIGGQTSIHAALGVQLNLPTFEAGTTRLVQPHARLALGGLWLTGDGASRAGLDFSYGATFDRPGRPTDDRAPRLFVEHQGIDMFAVNRFVVGLTWNR